LEQGLAVGKKGEPASVVVVREDIPRIARSGRSGFPCFKWIKQHLRIKAFYGTSENAVKTQIWIAISV